MNDTIEKLAQWVQNWDTISQLVSRVNHWDRRDVYELRDVLEDLEWELRQTKWNVITRIEIPKMYKRAGVKPPHSSLPRLCSA